MSIFSKLSWVTCRKSIPYNYFTDNCQTIDIKYNPAGKTGTAQIAKDGSGYLTGDSNLNRSVALMFPKDNPEIIIYGVLRLTCIFN